MVCSGALVSKWKPELAVEPVAVTVGAVLETVGAVWICEVASVLVSMAGRTICEAYFCSMANQAIRRMTQSETTVMPVRSIIKFGIRNSEFGVPFLAPGHARRHSRDDSGKSVWPPAGRRPALPVNEWRPSRSAN